jgi:Leucine-rich repeat (LRR) protein
MFKCLPSLETLKLSLNWFNTLYSYLVRAVPNFRVLFIQQNVELKIIDKLAFNIPSLKQLYFGYNNFRFDKSGCKSRFDPYNIFKHLPRLQHLDLTNNYLPSDNNTLSLMFQYLRNLEHLILQAANVHELHWRVFQPLKSLRKLILQGNFIEFWPDGTFDGLTSLQYLNLQNNRIHLLNETSISANVLNGLQKLYLSNNPFTCTCDLMWFRDWIKTTNTSLSSNFPAEYKCTFPIIMQGQRLIDYNPTKKSCTEWNPLFTMAIIISTFGFLVLVVILTVYKCHANILNYFYLLRLSRLRKKMISTPW